MKNVAVISHSDYLQGAQKVLAETVLLYRDNLQTNMKAVLSPMTNTELNEYISLNKGDIIYGPLVTPPKNWYIYKSPNREQQFKEYCKEIKKDLDSYIELFKNNNIDVVILNTLTQFTPLVAAYILGIPSIAWVHGYLDPEEIKAIDPNYQKLVDKSIYDLSDYILYCSGSPKEIYKNILTNYNYLDDIILNFTLEQKKSVQYKDAEKKFVCLNRMEESKGVITLVYAAEILRDKGYKFKIDIYGDGREKINILNTINEKKLNDYVEVHNRVIDVTNIYENSIALIQPSHVESFGITTIEAMSHERPVLLAKTADPVHIIEDGYSGYHFEKNDFNTLALHMMFILDNINTAETMGKNGYKVYKELYNGDSAREKFDEIFEKISKVDDEKQAIKKQAFDELNKVHFNLFEKE